MRHACSWLVTDVSGSMDDCAEWRNETHCFYEYCLIEIFGTCILWWPINCPYTGTCNDDECGTGEQTRNHYVGNASVCNRTKLDLAKEGNMTS